RFGGMECAVANNVHDGIPLVFGEFVHRSDMLDTCIVNQYINWAEFPGTIGSHLADFFGLCHIGIAIGSLGTAQAFKLLTQCFNFGLIAKTVNHYGSAFRSQGYGIASANSGSRACNQCRLTLQKHLFSPWRDLKTICND